MTPEQPIEGERRHVFTPNHEIHRLEDQILTAIITHVTTVMTASPYEETAMFLNKAGEIVAAAQINDGETQIATIGGGTDDIRLTYSGFKGNMAEPAIYGIRRTPKGNEYELFTPTKQRAEYTKRLTALALRIGALGVQPPLRSVPSPGRTA